MVDELGSHLAFTPRRFLVCIVLVVMMILNLVSVTGLIVQAEESTSYSYENLSASEAFDMITNGSLPELVVLDVRNQSEYVMGHLSGAILIPCNTLQTRIGELEEHETMR